MEVAYESSVNMERNRMAHALEFGLLMNHGCVLASVAVNHCLSDVENDGRKLGRRLVTLPYISRSNIEAIDRAVGLPINNWWFVIMIKRPYWNRNFFFTLNATVCISFVLS